MFQRMTHIMTSALLAIACLTTYAEDWSRFPGTWRFPESSSHFQKRITANPLVPPGQPGLENRAARAGGIQPNRGRWKSIGYLLLRIWD